MQDQNDKKIKAMYQAMVFTVARASFAHALQTYMANKQPIKNGEAENRTA